MDNFQIIMLQEWFNKYRDSAHSYMTDYFYPPYTNTDRTFKVFTGVQGENDFQRIFKIFIAKDVLQKEEISFTDEEKKNLLNMLDSKDQDAQELAFTIIRNNFLEKKNK